MVAGTLMSRGLKESGALLAFLATIFHALLLAWHSPLAMGHHGTASAIHAMCLQDVTGTTAPPDDAPAPLAPDGLACPICQGLASAGAAIVPPAAILLPAHPVATPEQFPAAIAATPSPARAPGNKDPPVSIC